MKVAGIRLTHVPYQGMTPAMNDLIGGHIDLMIDLFFNASQYIGDGKLKLLAVTAEKQMPELPDVPAISQCPAGVQSSGMVRNRRPAEYAGGYCDQAFGSYLGDPPSCPMSQSG